jgi:universal stress protein family protein
MKLLVCTDFSAAAAAGEREAARRHPDATIVVFHASDPALPARLAEVSGLDRDRLWEGMLHYAEARMNEIVTRLESERRQAVAELVSGDPVDQALAAAARHAAELIVLGVPVPALVGRFRTLLARRSPVPILLVPFPSP